MNSSTTKDAGNMPDTSHSSFPSRPKSPPNPHPFLSKTLAFMSRGCRGFANLLHREEEAPSTFLHVSAVIGNESIASRYAINKTVEVKSMDHPHLNQMLKDFVPDFERSFRIPISTPDSTKMYATVLVAKVVNDAIKIGHVHNRSISGTTLINTPAATSPMQADFPYDVLDAHLDTLAGESMDEKVSDLRDDLTSEVGEMTTQKSAVEKAVKYIVQHSEGPYNASRHLRNQCMNGIGQRLSARRSRKNSVLKNSKIVKEGLLKLCTKSLQQAKTELAQKDGHIHSLDKRLQGYTAKTRELTNRLQKKSNPLGFIEKEPIVSDFEETVDLVEAFNSKEAAFDILREEMKEASFMHHTVKRQFECQTENVSTARAEIARLNTLNDENAQAMSQLLSSNDAKQELIEHLEASVKATHGRIVNQPTEPSENPLKKDLDETEEKLAASEEAHNGIKHELDETKRKLAASESAYQDLANELDETKEKLVASEEAQDNVAHELQSAQRAYDMNLKEQKEYYTQKFKDTLENAKAVWNAKAIKHDDKMKTEMDNLLKYIHDKQLKTIAEYEEALAFLQDTVNSQVTLGKMLARRGIEVQKFFEGKGCEIRFEDLNMLEEAKSRFIGAEEETPIPHNRGFVLEVEDENVEEDSSESWSTQDSDPEYNGEDELNDIEFEYYAGLGDEQVLDDGPATEVVEEILDCGPLAGTIASSATTPGANASTLWGILESDNLCGDSDFAEHNGPSPAVKAEESISSPEPVPAGKDDENLSAVEMAAEVIGEPEADRVPNVSSDDSTTWSPSVPATLWGILESNNGQESAEAHIGPEAQPTFEVTLEDENARESEQLSADANHDDLLVNDASRRELSSTNCALIIYSNPLMSAMDSPPVPEQGESLQLRLNPQYTFAAHTACQHGAPRTSQNLNPEVDISVADTSDNPFAAKAAASPPQSSENARRVEIETNIRRALALRKTKEEEEAAQKPAVEGSTMSRQERRNAERRAEKEKKKGGKGAKK